MTQNISDIIHEIYNFRVLHDYKLQDGDTDKDVAIRYLKSHKKSSSYTLRMFLLNYFSNMDGIYG